MLFKHVSVHFSSKQFVYTVNKQRIKAFLIHSSLFNFLMFIPYFGAAIINIVQRQFVAVFFLLILAIVIGGIINLLLFFNYYRYMKNKMLILSKGNECFSFGDVQAATQYEKKYIDRVIITSSHKQRSNAALWSQFAIYQIHFNNNQYPIAFTSFLINKADFKNKFSPEIQIEEYKALPFYSA